MAFEALPERAETVLGFWFGPVADAVPKARRELWFGGSPAVDRTIRERFEEDLQRAASGECDPWRRQPRGTLALLLLLDQFPRNLFRNSPRAYAFDDLAREICQRGIEEGQDRSLGILERAFFYLPLEHAEDPRLQQRSVSAFEQLVEDAPAHLAPTCRSFLDFAVRHREIVDRFGRFPHRNRALGRPSTPEEEDFLRLPGSSF